MDSYALHLAMAAIVGASFVAVSAYYVHCNTLSQLLEFARAVERERERERDRDRSQNENRNKNRALKKKGEVEAESEEAEDLGIPLGLPKLHTAPADEGNKQSVCANSNKLSGKLTRPTSPKSSGASAYGSLEGSDDDDDTLPHDAQLDNSYLPTNGDLGPECKSSFKTFTDDITANGDSKPLPSANMIRSHSVSGDLHGVQPDPIAADLLRKEREQETFVRMKISPSETPSADEAEVYKILQECLELRQSYVFKEDIPPWEKEVITDPSTPKPNLNPFAYDAEQKTEHLFKMVEGVVHVYTSQEAMERIFPVADATTFFRDLHHILRVISAGNIRTLCHHRLNLLEQGIPFSENCTAP